MTWDQVEAEFHSMAGERHDEAHRERTVDAVRDLENGAVADPVALPE